MRACDMPPEQQAAHYERVRQGLERADEGLRASREREIPTELWQPREPQQAPAAVAEEGMTMSPETAANWNRWCDERIETRLEEFARMLGKEIGETDLEIIQRERAKRDKAIAEAERRVTDKIAASDAAVVDLLMQLEARVAALEEAQQQRTQASTRPRLIGGSDAA
jgi:hypothetical protein